MKDPIVGKYNGQEKIVSIDDINLWLNDPRAASEAQDEEQVYTLACRLADGSTLPIPVVMPTIYEGQKRFDAVRGRHTLLAHQLEIEEVKKSSKTVLVFVIDDKLTAEEAAHLAWIADAQHKPARALRYADHVRHAGALIEQGFTRQEIIEKMAPTVGKAGAGEYHRKAHDKICSKISGQALRDSLKPNGNLKVAVMALKLPKGVRHETILRRAETLAKNGLGDSDKTLLAKLSVRINSHFNGEAYSFDKAMLDTLADCQEAGQIPPDEIVLVYKKLIQLCNKRMKKYEGAQSQLIAFLTQKTKRKAA